jgi:hypothetical protein
MADDWQCPVFLELVGLELGAAVVAGVPEPAQISRLALNGQWVSEVMRAARCAALAADVGPCCC